MKFVRNTYQVWNDNIWRKKSAQLKFWFSCMANKAGIRKGWVWLSDKFCKALLASTHLWTLQVHCWKLHFLRIYWCWTLMRTLLGMKVEQRDKAIQLDLDNNVQDMLPEYYDYINNWLCTMHILLNQEIILWGQHEAMCFPVPCNKYDEADLSRLKREHLMLPVKRRSLPPEGLKLMQSFSAL